MSSAVLIAYRKDFVYFRRKTDGKPLTNQNGLDVRVALFFFL